eukprot:gnl/TRDRNA2_/TRDRNA2_158586_c0_seq1.p1 gnl/TRDRNA2_/TRDRNA2_158586_c0~~gnl/TRDRNA2_/TRDRNA2_158586_c0_seq1.p1  ORF type:complete len:243 (+),score=35.41 gnl/TRDRNA2_/TRDRNA2_158586_c0_seq1:133-861(+)
MIFVMGGGSLGERLRTVEALSPAGAGADSWTSWPALPKKRSGGAAATIGRCMYFMGGVDEGLGPSGKVFVFDTAAGAWEDGPPLREGRWGLGAAALDGKLYAVSGSSDNHNGPPSTTVEVLDPSIGEWQRGPSLQSARIDHAVAAWAGALWALGGSNENLVPFATTERWEPGARRWQHGPSLNQPRYDFAAAVAGGMLVAIGGSPAGNSVELLSDASGGHWELGPALTEPRRALAAAVSAGF